MPVPQQHAFTSSQRHARCPSDKRSRPADYM
jgi:hypothetical protein